MVTAQVGRIGKRSAFLSVDGGKAFRLNAEDKVVVTVSQRVIPIGEGKEFQLLQHTQQKISGVTTMEKSETDQNSGTYCAAGY